MRLIDADALKEEVSKKKVVGRFNTLSLIDAAPTVAYPFEKFRTMLCGTCQANMRVEPERPSGEWIIVKDKKYGDNFKCPFCGKELAGTDLNEG